MSRTAVRPLKEMHSRWRLSDEERNFGSLKCQHGMLPLEDLKLRGAIRGLDFSLKLTQVFVNVHPQSIEAVYIFPLPARAAVSAFTMRTKDREVKGVLQERGEARANYAQAISEGKQAALVEEERPEIFTMTVGNLPAGERVTVELELDGPLTCIDDTALFRFPLVVAPKYIPGKGLAGRDVGAGTSGDTDRVPDASRISPPVLLPGYPNPVRLSIEIDMDSPLLDWHQLEASLPFQVEQVTGKKRRRAQTSNKLVYLPQTGRIDHDLVLAFPFHPSQMQTSLQVLEPEASVSKSEALPFCLTIVPPASLSEETAEKQVVILLDRSGSMGGWKMAAAIRTVARLIDSLNSDDSFSILAFDNLIEEIVPVHIQETPRSQNWFKLNQAILLVEANDRNRCDYNTALKSVTARGGTDIALALDHGLKLFGNSRNDDSVERHIVLVTDGQVGNEGEIIDFLRWEAKGVRVSTVGIDQAINQEFLERVASTTQGLCQVVLSDEQLDRSMTSLCRRIGNPVLKNLRVEGCQTQDLVFQHNDLYAGIATRIYGRLPGRVPEKLKIVAERSDGSNFVQEVEVDTCVGTIEKLWARERVLQMEHEFLVAPQGRNTTALVQDTTAFSLRYGVLCRFTAFLAVDHESRVPTQSRTLVQAVESPAGWTEAPMPVRQRVAAPPPSCPPARASEMLSSTISPSPKRSEQPPAILKSMWLRDKEAACSAPPPSSAASGWVQGCAKSVSSNESTKMDNPSASSTEEILDQIKDLLGRLSRNDKPLTILDSLEKLLKMLGNLLPKMRERGALFKAQLSSGGAMNLSELKAWAQDLESQLRPKSPSFFGRLIGSIRKEK